MRRGGRGDAEAGVAHACGLRPGMVKSEQLLAKNCVRFFCARVTIHD